MNLGETFVKTIQKGLNEALRSRNDAGLTFNNLKWNFNSNYIFSSLQAEFTDFDLGIEFRTIRRWGYAMPCFYEPATKTLYSIISKDRLISLKKRKVIERPHCTDALCMLSKDEGSHIQLNFWGEPVCAANPKTLEELLKQLSISFDGFEIDHYALITCAINHHTCQLNEIVVNYMSKHYDIIKSDTTWNKFVSVNYDTLIEEDRNYETKEFDIPVALKQNVKLKSEKEDEIQID